jgi:hypothetical protein
MNMRSFWYVFRVFLHQKTYHKKLYVQSGTSDQNTRCLENAEDTKN